jgi:hypothetical protein
MIYRKFLARKWQPLHRQSVILKTVVNSSCAGFVRTSPIWQFFPRKHELSGLASICKFNIGSHFFLVFRPASSLASRV